MQVHTGVANVCAATELVKGQLIIYVFICVLFQSGGGADMYRLVFHSFSKTAWPKLVNAGCVSVEAAIGR